MTLRRRAFTAPTLALLLLGAVACSSDGGSGSTDDPAHPAADAGDDTGATVPADGGDAVLIPPAGETSPTSGPPNTDPLASAAAPAAATCEGRTASPAAAAEDLDLRVVLGETLETGRVRWALELRNQGDGPVTLVYPTAQDGDVVLRRDGDEAYRWSAGRTFAAGERCQVIGAAQSYRVELAGSPLAVEPGDYELVARLGAAPAPAPARVDVTLEDGDGG